MGARNMEEWPKSSAGTVGDECLHERAELEMHARLPSENTWGLQKALKSARALVLTARRRVAETSGCA